MARPRFALTLPRRVEVLSQHTFASFVASHPKAIIQIGVGVRPSFLPDVLSYFAAEHQDAICFGYLNRARVVAFPTWSLKHVGNVFRSRSAAPKQAPDGYYLFADGRAIAFHRGHSGEPENDLAVLGVGALIALLASSSKPLGASLDAIHRKAAQGVIAFFEEVLQKSSPHEDWKDFVDALQAKVRPIDPYAVLAISSSATDDEVKTAYHEQQKRNHPDLVARMSPEIQEFAHERTQAINAAYSEILKARRKR